MISPFLFLLAMQGAFVQSQFLQPTSNLNETSGAFNTTVRYKQVPYGICETTPGVNSYSGYVDIDDNTHVYWWFFEARNQDPTTAPLTVWLSGGPGASSMLGALIENGPCRIDANGDPSYNPYSWTNASNVLYIDQPIDVGFSYSRAVPSYQSVGGSPVYTVGLPDYSCPSYLSEDEASSCGTWSDVSAHFTSNSTNNAKDTLWRALQGFIGAFPQYSKSNGFHIACESFGGHYCPVYSNYILEQNSLIEDGKLPGALQIDLRAVLIGNGWIDPILQYESFYNFSIDPGNTYGKQLSDPEAHDQLSNTLWGPGNCVDQLRECRQSDRDDVCSIASSWCSSMVEAATNNLTNNYDIRAPPNDANPPRAACDIYLNRPEIQEALGVVTNFTWLSQIISQSTFPSTGSDSARYEGVIDDIRNLTNAGVYITQYHGDADYTCNWYGGEAVANEIQVPGFDSAGYQNLTSMGDGKVGGQVKQSANYAFVRVYEAGHEVPFYQPLVALELFNRTVRGLDVATGTMSIKTGDGYKIVGPPTSDLWEGNGTMH